MLVAFRVTFVVVFPKNTWRREEEVGKKKKRKKETNRATNNECEQRVSLSLCFREMALFSPLIFNNISR